MRAKSFHKSRYSDILRDLEKRGMFHMEPGLERTRAVCDALGHPERSFRSIHVAGTNGKGSVAAAIESVLRHAGYKTGLYTSPHLISVKERIQISGKPITEGQFVEGSQSILDAEAKLQLQLTYFEFLTVLAFLTFRTARIQAAIVEVGMGGRLDATNVLTSPILSIITRIGLDHTAWLGQTESRIAKEKAGIIRARSTVVTGADGKALTVIARIARQHSARLSVLNKNCEGKVETARWSAGYQIIRYTSRDALAGAWRFKLLGPHQADNLAIALRSLHYLQAQGFVLPPKKIAEGLRRISWPGRMQLLRRRGRAPVLIDGAHNPQGAQCLVDAIKSSPWAHRTIHFIFGVYKDKDVPGILKSIVSIASSMVVCAPASERAFSSSQLSTHIARHFPHIKILNGKTFRKSIGLADNLAQPSDLIVVCGSLALAGDALATL